MMSRALTHLLMTLVAVACVASPVAAQQLHGRVLDGQRRPLIGALIELRTPAGRSIQLTLTSASGNFIVVAPDTGRYLYRVAAIGFQPIPPTSVDIPANGRNLGDIELHTLTLRLPDLIAVAKGRFCGKAMPNESIFDRLIEGAHTALQVMETAVNTHQIAFEVARIDSRTVYGAYTNFETADTIIQPLARWPIVSIDPDTLRTLGFGRELEPGNENSREYYGPDARILFSDWFLASHCFTIDRPDRKHPSDSLHLRFAPARKGKLVDIAGEMVLDAHTLALLQLTFTHQNLPRWMMTDAAGGNMEFAPMPSGLWITRSWSLWAPLGGVGVDGKLTTRGEVERYGWVLNILSGDSIPGHVPGR